MIKAYNIQPEFFIRYRHELCVILNLFFPLSFDKQHKKTKKYSRNFVLFSKLRNFPDGEEETSRFRPQHETKWGIDVQ